jgi:hypothetical protein
MYIVERNIHADDQSAEHLWVRVRNCTEHKTTTAYVENKDTPEHLTYGLGDIPTRTFCFRSSTININRSNVS